MAEMRPAAEMKDSEIAYIGDIPESWRIIKLKYAVDCLDGKRIPIDASLRKPGPYPYWGAGKIMDYVDDYIFEDEIVLLGEDGAPFFDDYRPVSHYVNEKVWVNNHIHVLRPKGINPKYLVHCLNSVDYHEYINGTILNKLTQGNMMNIILPLAPLSEQQAIADYLDDRCSKIDEIIAEATASIEEYKELKQAVIDQYSMFGINKDVDLRDTDYSWFPYMPAHWKLVRANRLFKEDVRPVQDGDVSLSLSQIDGLIPTDDMSERSLKSATHDNWKHVIPEDLVLNRFKGHLGVFFASKYEGMVSFHYGVYHAIRDGVLSKYYEYLFHSTTYKSIFALLSNGITVGLQNLSNGNFYSVKLLLPPIEEQVDIVRHLDERTSQIDALISEKQALINDLQAYKKSLIYEVVTGKRRVV